jgi:hypothetical protein
MFDYAVVAILGGIVGLGELASRYRDAPERALSRSGAAVVTAQGFAPAGATAAGTTLCCLREGAK